MATTRATAKTNTRRKPKEESLIPEEATEVAADVIDYLREYAREKPEVAAMWCFGIGFVLGWKLKIW